MIKVLSAFLAGVAAGLLFAPQSGEKTRAKIAGIFTKEVENFKSTFQDDIENVPDVYERIELEGRSGNEPSYYSTQ